MKKRNTVIGLLLVISIIVVAFNFFREGNSPYIKQTAKIGNYTNTIAAQAIVIRNETVVKSGAGAFEAAVSEGERVGAFAKIGTVVTGDVNQEKLNELEKLNKEIDALSSNISDAGVLAIADNKVQATLSLSLDNLTYYAARDDVKTCVKLGEDIKILAERKAGKTSGILAEDNLNALIAKRDEIAASLGGSHQNLYTPMPGLFSKNLDGMEEVLTFDIIDAITPEAIDIYSELMKKREGEGICKVVNNFKWYIAMILDKSEADSLKKGKEYTVAFEEGDCEIEGEVTHISQPDEDNRVSVVFKFTHHIDAISNIRKVNVKICKEKYSGIYIPATAIRVLDGVLGVYVQNEKSVHFRSVEVIYRTDDFVLAKEGSEGIAPFKSVQLHDGLILNPDDGDK